MIEEYAVVKECFGTQANLEIQRRTACGLCGKKRGCGNAAWGKLLGHHALDFTAHNKIEAKVGDTVVVGIDEKAMLNSVFFMYVVPLIGLLLSTMLADYFFKNQLYVMTAAFTGLALGLLWAKGHLMGQHPSGLADSKNHQAIILRLSDEAPLNASCQSSSKLK